MNHHENQTYSYLMIRLPVKWIAFNISSITNSLTHKNLIKHRKNLKAVKHQHSLQFR